MLVKSVDVIKMYEQSLSDKLEKELLISATIAKDYTTYFGDFDVREDINDLESIIDICKEDGIELSGIIFTKNTNEVKQIIEICKKLGIKVGGTVFLEVLRK